MCGENVKDLQKFFKFQVYSMVLLTIVTMLTLDLQNLFITRNLYPLTNICPLPSPTSDHHPSILLYKLDLFSLKIPHMNMIIQYFSFCFCFISVIIFSRSIHAITNGRFAFFFWLNSISLYIFNHISLSIHLSRHGGFSISWLCE